MPKSRSMLLLSVAGLVCAIAVRPVFGHDENGAPAGVSAQEKTADAVWADPVARARAQKAGAPLFARHCAGCHGADARGKSDAHTPDLTDGRWLYGGEDIDTFLIRASDIAFTIDHGIRADDPQTHNLALMPALGTGHSLEPDEVAAVTEYVLKLSGQPFDETKIAAGKETYEGEGGCYDCHTMQGWGDPAIGAADLTHPETWLYGSDRAAVAATVIQGRAGVSPAFAGKLTPAQVRDVSIYVLSRAKSRKYI